MKLGIVLRLMGESSQPEVVMACARAADSSPLDELWVPASYVSLLAGIGIEVVELGAVHKSPAIGHHRALAPLARVLDPLGVDEQRAILGRWPSPQQGRGE